MDGYIKLNRSQDSFLRWVYVNQPIIGVNDENGLLIKRVIKDVWYLEKDKPKLNWIREKFMQEYKTYIKK
jgi:hypothetical protein